MLASPLVVPERVRVAEGGRVTAQCVSPGGSGGRQVEREVWSNDRGRVKGRGRGRGRGRVVVVVVGMW